MKYLWQSSEWDAEEWETIEAASPEQAAERAAEFVDDKTHGCCPYADGDETTISIRKDLDSPAECYCIQVKTTYTYWANLLRRG